MKRGLVLGGGGLVGMGYHAGALKALDEWGLDPASAEVIVGTSAGSIIGSYLATGWRASDFYDYAHGRHPDSERTEDEQRDAVRRVFEPLSQTAAEKIRRSLGSAFAIASARGLWRAGAKGKVPAKALRSLFPSGMYSTEGTRERLRNDLPEQWPDRELFISTADVYSGRRVAFGTPDAPPAPLPDAVLASTTIPGVFPPVRIGDRRYVDGGIVTATSLDLAADAGCTAILCVAPLGYRLEGWGPLRDPRAWGPMFTRSLFARSLRREVNDARGRGIDVFVIRPWFSELRELGTNAMRYFDRKVLTDRAREGTLRILEENSDHPALTALAAVRTRESNPPEAGEIGLWAGRVRRSVSGGGRGSAS